MPTLQTVAEYETAITAEINLIQDEALRNTIYDLLEYAASKESQASQEADNREQRPRPDGTENTEFYRNEIDIALLPSQNLQELIEDLLDYVETLENQINAN